MKNAKQFITLYNKAAEERFARFGEYYPVRTWDELYADQNRIYEEHLKDKTVCGAATSAYLRLLPSALGDFGLYTAFQERSCETLNNVLFQTARRQLLLGGITAGGTDHCNFLLDLLTAFSCNDFEVFARFFPASLPFAVSPFYVAPAMNMIKVLYYGESVHLPEVQAQADSFLKKKSAVFDTAVVGYLAALIRRDHKAAGGALEQACAGYQRMQTGYVFGKYMKCFAKEVHGLYRLARLVDSDFFETVTPPEHPAFCAEFECWQKEHQYPAGRLFYRYPDEMHYMNRIFAAPIPDVALVVGRRKNERYKDVDKFLADLTAAVQRVP